MDYARYHLLPPNTDFYFLQCYKIRDDVQHFKYEYVGETLDVYEAIAFAEFLLEQKVFGKINVRIATTTGGSSVVGNTVIRTLE